MNTTTLTVGSVTYALKAKKALMRIGIRSELIKTEDSQRRSGCAYGIRFNSDLFYSVIDELRNNAIKYEVFVSE